MSNYPKTREMRLQQVERCLDSGMQIKQWCELNKIARSTFYGWLKVYREESKGKEKSNSDWIEFTRQEIKDSKALAIKNNKEESTESPEASESTLANMNLPSALQVSLNNAVIAIPSGCDETTIKSVLSVVATL